MKKLFITGATGFVGSFLTEEAVKQGFEVVAAIRKNSDLTYIKDLPVSLLEVDFNDEVKLMHQLAEIRPDYIINNAGLTKGKTQHELDLVNSHYAENLANAAVKAKIPLKKFIHISSLAAYGPADFQDAGIVSDHHQPHPVTMYGKSKLKGEKKLKQINNLPLVILRPTAVYGPREKDLLTVFKMVAKGFSVYSGDGEQQLTFIYVLDLVNYILLALDLPKNGMCYFVSDGKVYSPKELNMFISRKLNKKSIKIGLHLPIVTIFGYLSEFAAGFSGKVPTLNVDKLNEIKARNWQCDVEPLMNDTKYRPAIFLEEGVGITADWYKKNNWI